nr:MULTISPECIES: hypothetical protein [unclassified Sulfolobus]
MQEVKKLHEDEEVEGIALHVSDEEVEIIDRSGVIRGKFHLNNWLRKL